ncbi:ABC transporter ATP-binding protein [Microvirga guangxiensis]|uniref:Putative ABC transport system ATP-binding protein n=1 Tax=Microvirga guangxiensis TaxID=549386 RepID=A0A1G5K3I9_9HYPH|nr:ABC transporter ATP-binding protein [Microvirga guangxiensis]SCY94588.1 putative ABC transport system ATP-binding protein [Microvirga guangxiensis]
MVPPLIQATELRKEHRLGDATVTALCGVSLTIESGEFIAIMGPSGSGKSTLMHLLGLLDHPTAGSYRLGGRDVTDLGADERARTRAQKIGFIFQAFNLLGRSTAIENVELAMTYAGVPRKERRLRAVTALEKVSLGHRQHHWPGQLSGGEQQRVAIARVLAAGPGLILADEPTGALDTATGREVMALLQDLNRTGRTIVLVTHDPAIARYAKRIVRMQDGCAISDEAVVRDVGSDDAASQGLACPEKTAP